MYITLTLLLKCSVLILIHSCFKQLLTWKQWLTQCYFTFIRVVSMTCSAIRVCLQYWSCTHPHIYGHMHDCMYIHSHYGQNQFLEKSYEANQKQQLSNQGKCHQLLGGQVEIIPLKSNLDFWKGDFKLYSYGCYVYSHIFSFLVQDLYAIHMMHAHTPKHMHPQTSNIQIDRHRQTDTDTQTDTDADTN